MDLSGYKDRMQKTIDHLAGLLAGLQMGRATSSLVDNISVAASYGVMKMNQIANIVVMDAQTLKIEPWDKSMSPAIEKAIYDANNGLTPQNDGDYVMIKIPMLTKERRQEVAKQVSKMGEDTKIALRKIRQDANKDIGKLHEAKELSDDAKKGEENKIDDIVKQMNGKIESMVKEKTEDVLNG